MFSKINENDEDDEMTTFSFFPSLRRKSSLPSRSPLCPRPACIVTIRSYCHTRQAALWKPVSVQVNTTTQTLYLVVASWALNAFFFSALPESQHWCPLMPGLCRLRPDSLLSPPRTFQDLTIQSKMHQLNQHQKEIDFWRFPLLRAVNKTLYLLIRYWVI